MTDTTMRALLDVHRTEIHDRDQEIANLERLVDTLQLERDRIGREKDQADRLRVAADERARANRE
ncbi:hypothetical protein SEA_PCORAL7_78 [Gordonia phage PCoral7]|uniref:Uncharacterized protein n=1 Tax=Gordonia phage Toast TaxID=2599852 RepID=A0A5J6TEE6_9CAUD|nr:hypothetical protein JZX81_gp79 [Gordonia phage Toast]QFG08137.1 hypothetical protein PBI_TOAST_79 [Gordonia phage Toast]UVF60586.1 hypothetical protein SEA_PCORAL7_78 [Gordonia phage PCoral7]